MKNLRFLLFTATFLISLLSYAQESTQMQHVMSSHDEAMAKMPDLVRLIGKLQPQVDSTKTGQKYQTAIDGLKSSNTSMMTWMQGFGERFTADEMLKGKSLTEEKQQWLLEEKKKVNALRKEITTSIKKANKLLKE